MLGKFGLLLPLCELLRFLVGERLMRPMLVVVNARGFDLPVRIIESIKSLKNR